MARAQSAGRPLMAPATTENGLSLIPVPAQAVAMIAPSIADHLAKAVTAARGRWTRDDMLRMAIEDRAQLWLIGTPGIKPAGILLTHIIRHEGSTFAEILMGVSDRPREWRAFQPWLEHWARHNGAQYLRYVRANKGKRRTVMDGFEPVATIYEKVL